MNAITLTVTPAAADLIIGALRQLPHQQVHDLVMELFVQVRQQLPAQPESEAVQAVEAEHVAEETGATD